MEFTRVDLESVYKQYSYPNMYTTNIFNTVYGKKSYFINKQTQSERRKQELILIKSLLQKNPQMLESWNKKMSIHDKKKNIEDEDPLFWELYKLVMKLDTNDLAHISSPLTTKKEFCYTLLDKCKVLKTNVQNMKLLEKNITDVANNSLSNDEQNIITQGKQSLAFITLLKKQYGIKSIDPIIAGLGIVEKFTFEMFIISVLLHDLNVCLIHKKTAQLITKYIEDDDVINDIQFTCVFIKDINYNEKLRTYTCTVQQQHNEGTQNMNTHEVNEIYYVCSNLMNKLKKITYYKISMLREILDKLNIDDYEIKKYFNINKIKKSHLYDFLTEIL